MTFEQGDQWQPLTSNLSGGGTVIFDVPWTEASDTEEQHPVEWWLELMPTATQEAPD